MTIGSEVGFTRRFIIIIIITTTPFDVEGREVSIPWFMIGIWYGTSLVYGMVHRWFIWYGTLLVYGMVHRWYMVWYIVGIWYGTLLVSEKAITIGMVHCWFRSKL